MHVSCWIANVSATGVPVSAMICGAQGFSFLRERFLELQEAPLAELLVGGPRGLVERAAGRDDRPLHIGRARIGGRADHRLGRGVDVVVGCPTRRLDQLAVDEHAVLERQILH